MRLPITILSLALAAVMLMLPLPSSPSVPLPAAGPALADDDGGGGGAGRNRGGEAAGHGGRTKAQRRHRPVNLFNVNPFRTAPQRPRRTARAAPAPRQALPDHASDEIVASGLSDAEITALTADGYAVLERQALSRTQRTVVKLRVPDGTTLEAARQRVASLNAGAEVDFNHYYRPRKADEACRGHNCQLLALLSWPALDIDRCAGLPAIGLIDTGINLDHPALKGRDIEVIGLSEDRPPSDRQHGTAIAAMLVGDPGTPQPGLLPDARLIAVDGFRTVGRSDTRMETFDLVRGLDELLERGVGVLNLSFTGPDNALLARAISDTHAAGVVVVAAAGNSGPRAEPLYPAAYAGVIAVTALDQRLAVYRRAAQGDHIDFAAPGVNIWAAASVSGWKPRTGTSFAAPFVTAVAALMRARDPALAGERVAEELSLSARDLGAPGRDPVFGWGLVQASVSCR